MLGPLPSQSQLNRTLLNNHGIKLTHQLGAGGFGSVWQGVELHSSRKFAVKILLPDNLLHYKNVKAELDHLQICSQHDRFPTFYYHGMTLGGVEYIVTELAAGDLRNLRMDSSLWNHGRLAYYGKQVLEGLLHLDYLGICHRDIKPANIFISQEGDILIGQCSSLFLVP